jgi:hypothetical protein
MVRGGRPRRGVQVRERCLADAGGPWTTPIVPATKMSRHT